MEYYINKFSRMSIKQAVARDRQSHISRMKILEVVLKYTKFLKFLYPQKSFALQYNYMVFYK